MISVYRNLEIYEVKTQNLRIQSNLSVTIKKAAFKPIIWAQILSEMENLGLKIKIPQDYWSLEIR